jgi:hypothetical protein
MTRPAFLVEGDLEQMFIQNACKGQPVKKVICNGKDVSLSAIAKRVGTHGRLLQRRCDVLVVIFDREDRSDPIERIEEKFRTELVREEISIPVIVGIPDRDIENWILADYQTFSESAGISSTPPIAVDDGNKGKSCIKMCLGGKKYVETIDGVKWLKSARATVIKDSSPSFKRFYEAMMAIPCWWLQQESMKV